MKKLYILNILILIPVLFCLSCATVETRTENPYVKGMQVEGQSIDIRVSFDIELIPVLEKALVENPEWKEKGVGLIEWVIQNKKKEPVKVSLISEISEWTPPVLDTINLAPYEQKVVVQSPFSMKLLKIYSIIPANLILRAKIENEIIYEETKNINIRAADEMIWSASKPYDLAFFIASWVTPKDPIIEQILSIAKEKLPDRSLHGYQQGNPEDVMRQVEAIFYAVRDIGISYVSSTVDFGRIRFSQRVRLPRDSVKQKAANCIDGAVLFASLFENIGLEPVIMLLPGHAIVGVKVAPGSGRAIFIETIFVGRPEYTFDDAANAGADRFKEAYRESKYNKNALVQVDIKQTRKLGYYPLWSASSE